LVERGHIPVRTCVVCGGKSAKTALLRTALTARERLVVLDRTQCMSGRGAYVCPECLPRLRFTKRVRKAFRDGALGLSEQIQQQLTLDHKGHALGMPGDEARRHPIHEDVSGEGKGEIGSHLDSTVPH
jgi:uncharacterized protein